MRKVVGLIGYPLGHSVSPAMHNAAFREMGLDYEYVPFEINPSELSEAVNGFRALHIAGFNVTVPHKETIVPLLNEVTELARIIGAVNTVENQDGRLIGYNTDGPGFIESLSEDCGFKVKGKNAVILGGGGASRAVAVMLAETGVKSIVITDVFEDKGETLAQYINSYFEVNCLFAKPDSPALLKAIEKCQLLVNATPIGTHPKVNDSPLPDKVKLNKAALVYDLVYNPAETKLLKTAKAAGCKTCSGLGMLVRQGALAFALFTGEEPPFETMWDAARRSLRSGK